MFLLEGILILVNLALLVYDLKLAYGIYERRVILPRLRAERDAVLSVKYAEAKVAQSKRNKQVNDKIRRAPKNVIKFPVPTRKAA